MTKVARSKATRWRAAVLVGIHVLFALHLAHWWATGETVSPLEPSESMEMSASSVINAGLIFFAVMILSTAVFGKFACGWGCHIIALQGLCRGLRWAGFASPTRARVAATAR